MGTNGDKITLIGLFPPAPGDFGRLFLFTKKDGACRLLFVL